ncbi:MULTISPECIES: GPW/gp25 family protein [Actinomadura]|uniref:GPW/gp25 family protein n=1 Tax=Actinomadura miaoliensis TaxID=430685 RepID=A0ABP7WS21_9ACTN
MSEPAAAPATDPVTLAFPFATTPAGGIRAARSDDGIRGAILQILFTAPGERVERPDFGCGLFDLVFEPNDPILAAAMEFTVGQALTRWLGDRIVVDGVDIEPAGELVTVEIAWVRRADRARQSIRVQFR